MSFLCLSRGLQVFLIGIRQLGASRGALVDRARALSGRIGVMPRTRLACIFTTWRDEVRERAVRTRREPLGARNMAFKVFHESRDEKHESRLLRKLPWSNGRTACLGSWGHESRDTNHESRPFSRALRPNGVMLRMQMRAAP